MKFTKWWDRRTNLEKEIDDVLIELSWCKPHSEEYKTVLSHLERLYNLKEKDNGRKVKLDTLIIVAGNLLGIILILKYEQTDIITSKALSFVLKGRV